MDPVVLTFDLHVLLGVLPIVLRVLIFVEMQERSVEIANLFFESSSVILGDQENSLVSLLVADSLVGWCRDLPLFHVHNRSHYVVG